MIIQNALVYFQGRFQEVDVRVREGRIEEIAPWLTGNDAVDCQGDFLVPGFLDIHTHGCRGYDFSSASLEEIDEMCGWYLRRGVTGVVGTTMTMEYEQYKEAAARLKEYIQGEKNRNLIGLNMEGPFLSKEKKGAHNEVFLMPVELGKIKELDRAAGGHYLIVDIAPELPGAMECIQALSREKVISLAHTGCDYKTAMEAFEKGAAQVTHLFNAMNGIHHRNPGPIGAAFDGGANIELICDGIHVASTVIRMVFAMMEEQVVIISDSMSASGLEDGEYQLGGQKVFVKEKKAVLADGTIAGSATDIGQALGYLVKNCKIPLEKVIPCMTEHPAKAIGKEKEMGKIEKGRFADLVLLGRDLQIKQVYLRGAAVEREKEERDDNNGKK